MVLPVVVAVATLVVGLWCFFAYLVAAFAEKGGHSYGGFFLLSLLTSPLIAWMVALFVEDRRTPRSVTVEGGSDRVDRLAKLAELRQAGALTEEEFAAEKARVLSEQEPQGH
jgi:uncharacterized membrane protein